MSKLPKPSGLKLPQINFNRQVTLCKEAPPTTSHFLVPTRLKRRSKSVTDLRTIAERPIIDFKAFKLHSQTKKTLQNENKPINEIKNMPVRTTSRTESKTAKGTKKVGTSTTSTGVKRPISANKSNDTGAPKPKMARTKIPDWDYKSRFNLANEKYINAQELIKDMKSKLSEYDEIATNYANLQEEAKELKESKESLTAKCDFLTIKNKELQELESQIIILEKLKVDHQKLLEENENNCKEVASLTEALKELNERHSNLSKEHEELLQNHKELTEKYRFFVEENKDLLNDLNSANKEIKLLKEENAAQKSDLQHYFSERRRLHNVIQDLKGNIRVFCRVRPPINSEEMERLQCYINFVGENGIEIRKSRESISQITGKIQELKGEFTFDKVFEPETSQEEVFEDLAQLVQSALDGYHVCVFAYGQTGSGKTYTMQGSDEPERRGMIPRTIDLIFENIAELERSGWKYSVQASFLEIYNENVRDLLNINCSQKLEIYYNDGKGTTVTNLTIQPIESAQELKEYMRLAHRNRATAATDFNEHSSRSHAVTKIYLEGTTKDENVIYKGSINLVDLAGSESAKTSNGERLTETKNINKSLATLGDVISALYGKSKHIPYRNSKLTYLLQSCLGGNSKTLMVVNISPFEECFGESISSLRFAAKVKEVKTGSKRNKTVLAPQIIKQKSTV